MINTKRMMVLDNSHRITVTNCLTPNQSDGGDSNNPELLTLNQRTGTDALGDATGFETYKGDEVLSSSTEQAHTGSKSCKVVTDGSQNNEGVKTSLTTIVNGTVYIGGAWVYAPNGQAMHLRLSDATATSVDVNFTGTGAWQWVEGTFTGTAAEKVTLVVSTGDIAAVTFYVDDLRLGKNDTTGFALYRGTETISVSPCTAYRNYRSIKCVTPGNVIGEGLYTTSLSPGGGLPYSESIWVKAPLGATLRVTLHTRAGAAVRGSIDITGTGDWEEIKLENITTQAEDIHFRIYVHTTSTAQAITFYVDSLMLETGSVAHDWIIGQGSYSFFRSRE